MNNQHQKCSNFSHLRLISKSKCNRHSSEVISKYFVPSTTSESSGSPNIRNSVDDPNEESEQDFMETECPYKSFLTNIDNATINTTATEDGDFKTPQQIKHTVLDQSFNKKVNIKPNKFTRKRNNWSNKRNSMKQTIFTRGDVNPEHLQLAIALSKSEQDQSETGVDKTIDPSKPIINQTLERFGFTSGIKLNVQHRRAPNERRKKTSRYRFITPVLLLRTETDRQRIISEKVSLILSENYITELASNFTEDYKQTLQSHNLQKYWNKNSDLFKLNTQDFSKVQDNNIFYVKTLTSISPSATKCGSLLRNWSTIPGRPLSPTPTNGTEESGIGISSIATENETNTNVNIYNCTSPDLFASDDEDVIEKSRTSLPNSLLYTNSNEPPEKTVVDLQKECNLNTDMNWTHKTALGNCKFYNKSQLQFSSETIPASPTPNTEAHEVLANKQYSEVQHKLGVVDIMDLTHNSDDELNNSSSAINDNVYVDRFRSVSLNVTDYVHSLLSQQQELKEDELIDLTQSSPEHICAEDENNYSNNMISKEHFNSNSLSAYDLQGYSQKEAAVEKKCLMPSESVTYDIPETLSNSTCDSLEACSETIDLYVNTVKNNTCHSLVSQVTTPKNKVTIKTSNVTPMTRYEEMSTPKIQDELTKFGVKPFNRHKGIKILQHIYDMTHPIGNQIVSLSDDQDPRVLKKRKSDNSPKKRTLKKYKSEPIIKPSYSLNATVLKNNLPAAAAVAEEEEEEEISADASMSDFIGEGAIEILQNWNVDEDPDNLIFETSQSKRILSCRVPFHIIFHNLVSANPKLKERILLYEPINVAGLRKSLQGLGYRFALKDIENFLHNKCITIKTKQNHTFATQKKKRHRKNTS